MAFLPWIDDNNLKSSVEKLLSSASKAKEKAQRDYNYNVIDPFAAMFEMAGFGMTYDEWLKSEIARQAQKSLQNVVGEFHQDILGSCDGWQNMGRGKEVDLLNVEKRIIAEVKNKYNTVSGGRLSDQYYAMEKLVNFKLNKYFGYTYYFVNIIPKRPVRTNKEFTPSDKTKGQKCTPNSLIREIDGASFYELVTGDVHALHNLFRVLPVVIGGLKKELHFELDTRSLETLFGAAFGAME